MFVIPPQFNNGELHWSSQVELGPARLRFDKAGCGTGVCVHWREDWQLRYYSGGAKAGPLAG